MSFNAFLSATTASNSAGVGPPKDDLMKLHVRMDVMMDSTARGKNLRLEHDSLQRLLGLLGLLI
jgi:hypothetical protein